jgi:hypothetical protein
LTAAKISGALAGERGCVLRGEAALERSKLLRAESRSTLTTDVPVGDTPELPTSRRTAGPALIADTIVKRWQDHLPLNRLEAIYRRDGIEARTRFTERIRWGIRSDSTSG